MKTSVNKKNTGSYYTPPTLSDFIIFHLFSYYSFKKNIKILEPSVGDGVFFDSLFRNRTFPKFNLSKYVKSLVIDAVEIEPKAIQESRLRTKNYVGKTRSISFLNEDYLTYNKRSNKKFDLIIGNPPYIKNHYLSEAQIKLCEAIHKKANLSPQKIKNIWPSFLIAGAQSLTENGVLCFVLPAELLQVIYAKELRDFLRDNFKRIEIFAFNQLIFDKIEQDVIVLICSKNQGTGVSFYHVNRLVDLKKPSYVKENSNIHRETLDKWTNYILSDSELKFLDSIKEKLHPIRHYSRAEAGIVTAANDFFIVNEKTVKEFDFQKIARPILQKSSLMPHTINYIKNDHDKILRAEQPALLLVFNAKKKKAFSKTAQRYLTRGVKRKINVRYKCKLRNHWYFIPSVWKSEGFFSKRTNLVPKIAANNANIFVTDAFYRIRMNEGKKIKDLVFSFYNSLTLTFAELEGRYYGGSVLELTPNEYKNLSIPYYDDVPAGHLDHLDTLLRKKERISKILDFTDKIILREHLGLSEKQVSRIKKIYFKLLKRRLKGKQKNKTKI